MCPGTSSVFVFKFGFALEFGEGLTLDFEGGDSLDVGGRERGAGGGYDSTLRVGEGENGCAELNGFKGCVLGDITGAGDSNGFAFEGALVGILDHVVNILLAY